jgi:hypothetical protein
MRHFKCVLVSRLIHPLGRRPLTVAAAALTLVLAGCGKEEVRTYRVAPESAPAPVAAAGNPHAADPHAGNPHAGGAAQPRIEYTTPTGWQAKPPSSMRAASFTIAGPDGLLADVAVIPMPGVGAPVGDMVNMWRSQLGLEQITGDAGAKSGETAEVAGGTAPLFDLVSAAELIEVKDGKHKARIVGVVLPRGETTWFFKLSGEDAQVASHKAAFKDFLKSVSFPTGTPAAPATAASGAMPPMAGMGAGALSPGADAVPSKPQWTVPAGWKEEPPTQMLVAKFSATANNAKADITVSAFPGDVGGLLANVNRWRRQISLPPMAEGDVEKQVKQLDSVPGKLMLVDLTGTDPKTSQPARLVGVIAPQAGQTWFYKLMGDAAVVGAQKDTLIQFAKGAKY